MQNRECGFLYTCIFPGRELYKKFGASTGDASYKDHAPKEIASALSQTSHFRDHLQGITDAIFKLHIVIHDARQTFTNGKKRIAGLKKNG